MALIICPDCGKQFSSYAAACPECGRPVSTIQSPQPLPVQEQPTPAVTEEAKPEMEQAAEAVQEEKLDPKTEDATPTLALGRQHRLGIAKGNRIIRAGLVFSILCAAAGTLAYKQQGTSEQYITMVRRGSEIMAVFTAVFFILGQALVCSGFFKRIFNKGGISGSAITGFVLSVMGLLMAILSILNLPEDTMFI